MVERIWLSIENALLIRLLPDSVSLFILAVVVYQPPSSKGTMTPQATQNRCVTRADRMGLI